MIEIRAISLSHYGDFADFLSMDINEIYDNREYELLVNLLWCQHHAELPMVEVVE